MGTWRDRLAQRMARWLYKKPPAIKKPRRSPPTDYLKPKDIRRIRFYMPDYRWASRKTGTPWRALATTHKIERGLSVKPCTGGIAQLDTGARTPAAGKAARNAYVRKAMKKYGVTTYGPLDSDHRTGLIVMAHVLKSKVPRRLRGASWTDEKWAEASFGYNGRAKYYNQHWQTGSGSTKRDWRWSPYVSNFLVVAGITRKLYVKGRQYHKGQRVAVKRTLYRNPGTLLLFRELRRRAIELA